MTKTFVSGRIIKRYEIPLKEIEELNNAFDKRKNTFKSKGPKLAGRIDTELEVNNLIVTLPIMQTIENFMNDYMMTLNNFGLANRPVYNLNILTMWINDMKPNEYNPPHTHHDGTGWSTVLFLKVPEFINDAKDPHKFHDGQLGFIGIDGESCTWMTPKVGDFYIFPACHQHCVMPFKTKNKGDVRRSMSFNFIEKIES